MIEFKGIANYNGNYSYKNEAQRNISNKGGEFNKLIGGESEDFAEPAKTPDTNKQVNEGDFIESKIEVITYNFTGRILKSEKFYGLNYDAVV